MPFSQENPNLEDGLSAGSVSDEDSDHGTESDSSLLGNYLAMDGAIEVISQRQGLNAAQNAIDDLEPNVFVNPLEEMRDEIEDTEHVVPAFSELDGLDSSAIADGVRNELHETILRRTTAPPGLPNRDYRNPFSSCSVKVDAVDKELEPQYIAEVTDILCNVGSDVSSKKEDCARDLERDSPSTKDPAAFSRIEEIDVFLPRSLLEKYGLV